MTFDPNFSTQHLAAAATGPELDEQTALGNGDFTEQFLLHLIRFVQYGTEKSELTAIEQILMNNASDIFAEIAESCHSNHGGGTRSLGLVPPPELAEDLQPLPGRFLDQSITDWPEQADETAAQTKKTTKKKSKRKSTKKKSSKKSSKRKRTKSR